MDPDFRQEWNAVNPGDAFEVKKDSKVYVKMADGTVVRVFEGTSHDLTTVLDVTSPLKGQLRTLDLLTHYDPV